MVIKYECEINRKCKSCVESSLFLFYFLDCSKTLYNGLLMREERNFIYGKEL